MSDPIHLHRMRARIDAMQAGIAQLKAERDALLKDAERYAVLRNREHGFFVEQERPGWITTLPMGKGLDAAIDAAMASSSKEGK